MEQPKLKLMFATREKKKESFMVLINVGAGLDVPCGTFFRGQKGEMLLCGGMAPTMGIAGKGNTFKSTIADYYELSAMDTMSLSGMAPTLELYDSENSVQSWRINGLAHFTTVLKDIDLFDANIIRLTRASDESGDAWYADLKKTLRVDKAKNSKDFKVTTPFLDPDGKPYKMMFPCFSLVDSLSNFKPKVILEMEDKAELGDSKGNTIFMRAGLLKTRLINEVGTLCTTTDHYMMMTAHVGKKFSMDTAPNSKDMQHMKADEQTKNVPEAFDQFPNIVLHTTGVSLLNNDGTKGEEYPKNPKDAERGDVDLNTVNLKTVRNKYGRSGLNLMVVVSQDYGLLPDVTDFHNCRENGRFGLNFSSPYWSLVLLPEVKFTRNTLRMTTASNPKLVRALEITHQYLQMTKYHRDSFEYPDFQDFYEKLEVQYGWDILLNSHTRWFPGMYDYHIPYLSIWDMLDMYYDRYVPYWWKPEMKKSVLETPKPKETKQA